MKCFHSLQLFAGYFAAYCVLSEVVFCGAFPVSEVTPVVFCADASGEVAPACESVVSEDCASESVVSEDCASVSVVSVSVVSVSWITSGSV